MALMNEQKLRISTANSPFTWWCQTFRHTPVSLYIAIISESVPTEKILGKKTELLEGSQNQMTV